MTKHPCAGRSKASRLVFEQIATGKAWGHNPRVTKALEKRGLLERTEQPEVGSGFCSGVYFSTFQVPTPVHIQWCQWCSEQPDLSGTNP